MSEASSTPEPSQSPGTDPGGPPTPAPDQAPSSVPGLPPAPAPSTPGAAPWAPLSPLAPPKPWAAPEPWDPSAASDAGLPPAATAEASAAGGSLPGGQPRSGYVPAGWPPTQPGPTQPGWPAGGNPAHAGWPPAGYPPPFAYPGQPPTRSGGDAKVIALVIGLVVVLVLGLCCCAGLGGLVTAAAEDRTTAGDPWYDKDETEPVDPWYDEDGTEPVDPPTFPADPSKKPVTRPTAGPAPVTVVYEVTGGGRADVAYFDADSDLIHVDSAKLPWRTTIRTNGQSRVMVEATRPYGENEPLTCRLSVTGAGPPATDTTTAVWRTTCSTG
ncbi:membrane protein [Micromonospora sp. MW-13]|nr:membrane protein [Micromonospora sp. MW-13]